MLIVLTIVSLIFYTMFIFVDKFQVENEINKELELLGTVVQTVQTQAIVKHTEMDIVIDENKISVKSPNVVYEHEVSEEISISTNFTDQTIGIKENGNLKKAGTITYTNESISKKIIFTIGNGRYRIE